MKIAITSSDGKNVDKHFGRATQFYIYELVAPVPKFIEKRNSIGYCSEEDNHNYNPNKLDLVYQKIKDCEILCTVKIGNVPAAQLQEKGINIIEFEGKLEKVFSSV
ncbi:MAG: NifB/NifX family molybdenum-iron cluster-binding protein [Bacteroidales bacterium]|nr:NifB/NifX family molybdenum-iron cluster-binding protein [Bacteroidales bacterium]